MENGSFEILVSIFKITFFQSFLSTISSLFFALMVGFILFRFQLKRLEPLLRGTFYLPTMIVVYITLFWLRLLGTESRLEYSLTAVVFAHVLLNGFWLSVKVMESIESIPLKKSGIAKTLGASSFRVFFDFIFPHFLSYLKAPLVLIFSLCFNSFSIVMLIGGGPPIQTFETEIYEGLRMSSQGLSGIIPFLGIQAFMGFFYVYLLKGFSLEVQNTQMVTEELPHVNEKKCAGHKRSLKGISDGFWLMVVFLFLGIPFLKGSLIGENDFFKGVGIILKNESFKESMLYSARIALCTTFALSGLLQLCLIHLKIAKAIFTFSNFLSAFSPLFLAAVLFKGRMNFLNLILLSSVIQFSFQYKILYFFRESLEHRPVFKNFKMAQVLGAHKVTSFFHHLFPEYKWVMFSSLLSILFFSFSESSISFLGSDAGSGSVPYSVWLSRSESRYSFSEVESSYFLLFLFWVIFIFLQSLFQSRSRAFKQINKAT